MKRERPLTRRKPLQRRSSLGQRSVSSSLAGREPRSGRSSGGLSRRNGFAASSAQRAKVKELPCLVCGIEPYEAKIDPAHLCARANGGCDEADCVVPLCRICHSAFDDGRLNILPDLRRSRDETRWLVEIIHALVHYEGNLLGLAHWLTGERHYTLAEAAAISAAPQTLGLFDRTEP